MKITMMSSVMETELKNNIGRIFQEEKDRLLFYIRQKVTRLEDAEDILQDIFFQTMRGYSVTEPIENLLGWLFTAARNRIVDYYRRKNRQPVSLEDDSINLRSLAEDYLNPEDQLINQSLADALCEAIEMLPDKQQQIVVWQMIEGRSFQEISSMTGESINTLLSRKRYAVQTLRKKLNDFKNLLNK
jgi:RNA polymerase sigma factor (sigma-70 family)